MCSNGNETGLIGSAAGPKAALETMFGVFIEPFVELPGHYCDPNTSDS